MAPLPQAPSTVQIVMPYTGPGGVKGINIFHAYSAQSYDNSDLVTLATEVTSVLCNGSGDNYRALLSNTWTIGDATVTDLYNGQGEATATNGGVTGSSDYGALSPNVAVAISWNIAARYRGGKPRNYMPGINTSAVTTAGGNDITAQAVTYMVDTGDDLLEGVNGTSPSGGGFWSLGCIARSSNHVKLDPPIFRPYLNCKVDSRLDSQRRRLGKYPSS